MYKSMCFTKKKEIINSINVSSIGYIMDCRKKNQHLLLSLKVRTNFKLTEEFFFFKKKKKKKIPKIVLN